VKRFAVFHRGELIGITWAHTAKQAIEMCRRFTGQRATSAREVEL
jgi:hypothetical protein